MHFSKLVLAVLPALAFAEDTTTQTSTAVVTKTYFLSQVHTVTATGYSTEVEAKTETTEADVTSTPVLSETSTFVHLVNSTAHESTPKSTVASTATSGGSEPSNVPENAGSAVHAGSLALAGVAGMVIAALL
ncbi:hypothetical protein FDECE_7348 [Fusarium decemcellulare]|nr:hypothetical protein FDECE_7348 [Fusarium decemcellulare]